MTTTWIPSAEAFGTPTQILGVGPEGIPSAEAFGAASITHSSVTLVQPTGIPSGETFGATSQAFVLDPSGIPSAETFGSSVVNEATTVLLVSGSTSGTSLLLLGDVPLAATFTGTSDLTATVIRVISLDPTIYGYGDLVWSGPLPVYGVAILSAFLDLVRVPRPLCPPLPVKKFRYNQTLGRGDLEIVITDTSGQPFAPVSITFTFYQVVRGGQRQQVGPMRRRPVPDQREGQPGRYYVTGTAGELGQPGEWICVWTYQRSWWTSAVKVEQAFRVEAAHVYGCGCGCERDGYRRKRGWL